MKFLEYINERYLSIDELKFEEEWINISKKCKLFLNDFRKFDYNTNFLWRSTDNTNKVSKIIKTRKDRRPKDTPKRVHDWLNRILKDKFGWNVRSEGVFAVGDYFSAKGWGYDTYIIIPIGKYDIVWSQKVDDFTDYYDMNTINSLIWKNESIEYDDKEWDKTEIKNIKEKLKKYENDIYKNYEKGNLYKAIKSQNEIMIKCDSYYLINGDYADLLKKLIFKGKK